MATYAIGDIQGCYIELIKLLEKIQFDKSKDQLWFVGDLVNRGAGSLETLRFIKSLGDSAICVLGNHDIHLLAVHAGLRKMHKSDTLNPILEATDADELIRWLRHLPLAHYDKKLNYLMVHAGLAPQWTAEHAVKLSREIEKELQSKDYKHYKKILENIFGDKPRSWKESFDKEERLRAIVNLMTRLRAFDQNGKIDHDFKQPYLDLPEHLTAWFEMPNRQSQTTRIIFGHWAALGLKISVEHNICALDSGCVWGGKLTAFCLETEEIFQVDSEQELKKK